MADSQPQPSQASAEGDPQSSQEPAQTAQARYKQRKRIFETRTQAWREAGLLRQISPRAIKRARIESLLLVPLFIGVIVVYEHLESLYGRPLAASERTPIQIGAVIALMMLGWVIARAFGRAFGPALFRRVEPSTAGTLGFLIRLATAGVTFLVALHVANLSGQTLALGSALTAVVLGLAAQQTLGNVIAGTMLLSTRPFRVGDRVRLQGGALGGPVDGVVSSLGLYYTTFASAEDLVMIPNSLVMSVLVITDEDQRVPQPFAGPPRPPGR